VPYRCAVPVYLKQRDPAVPGTIPYALDMFRSEVRFYREIGDAAGVRVPACYRAEDNDSGTLLELEDLSGWAEGADPAAAAAMLAGMHERWSGRAHLQWPWLRRIGAAVELVEDLYTQTWAQLAARRDLTMPARDLGERLVGHVAQSEYATSRGGPITLAHGDASLINMRTGPDAEIALLDWEDVSAAPGVTDLAWLLVSSVPPAQWDDVIAGYGTAASGLPHVLPAATVQGLLSLSDSPDDSADAAAWIERVSEAAKRLQAS